jgi:hypothetical protein
MTRKPLGNLRDAITARENIDISGSYDVDNDPVEPLPTRRDVLKAV